MLTFLADFSQTFGALNVFRYITFRTGGATVTALLLVFLFGPAIINALRLKQGKGQPIRLDGPESHLLTKKGTPTMGGLMILFGAVVSILLWANPKSPFVWIVLMVTLGFGAIGFYDDYLKVTRQTHDGFSGRRYNDIFWPVKHHRAGSAAGQRLRARHGFVFHFVRLIRDHRGRQRGQSDRRP